MIEATTACESPALILIIYITSKITLLLQSYTLIFFEGAPLPSKKKLEVYFSTGNKGVDDEVISPRFCINYKRFLANSLSCLEFR
jgi:hypothetical protein